MVSPGLVLTQRQAAAQTVCSAVASPHAAPSAPVRRGLPSPLVLSPSTTQGTEDAPDISQHRVALERLWFDGDAAVNLQEPVVLAYAPLDSQCQPVWHISTPPTGEKPQRTRNQERSPDYFANVGDAIRVLREDVPLLFAKDLDYRIYRDDIVFKDPRNTFSGIKNYKLIFWSLRFHGKIFFSRLYVEVKRIWQPSDDVIKMRWTVHGIPRVPWEAQGVFDGISTYKLDHEGKVYEHSVDNVLLRDPPVATNPMLAGLNLVPNAPQQPCPGAWGSGASLAAQALLQQASDVDGFHELADSPLVQPPIGVLSVRAHPTLAAHTAPIRTAPQPVVLQLPEDAQLCSIHAISTSAGPAASSATAAPAAPSAQHAVSHSTNATAVVPRTPQATGLEASALVHVSQVAAAQRMSHWHQFSWVRLYAAWVGSVSILAAVQSCLQAGGSTLMEPSPSQG